VARVVDTTGAGDLFAAGFLYGLTQELPLAECGRLGAAAAAEIISHYGGRPQTPLSDYVARPGWAGTAARPALFLDCGGASFAAVTPQEQDHGRPGPLE
jgi:hypothetical protein